MHILSVHLDAEDAVSGPCPVGFREMHLDGVRGIRNQASQNIGEGHIAFG